MKHIGITSFVKKHDEITIFSVVMMITLLMYILFSVLKSGYWGDVSHYYVNISDVMDRHLMPYSETKFEYPPLTLLFFAIPKLLSFDEESFFIAFAIESMIFLFIGYYFIYKISEKFPLSKTKTLFIMTILILFSCSFILTRNDVFPTTLLIIAIWFYLDKKYVWASVVLALAAMVKIYPAFLIFAFVIPLFVKKDWSSLFKSAIAFIAVCLIIELPFLITDPNTAFAYLTYHSDRGIQIESILGSIILFINIFIPGLVTVEASYGSENLVGQIPDAIAPFMDYIMVAAIIVFTVAAIYKFKKNNTPEFYMRRNTACVAVLIVLMIFITFSKVYSAQYMIWIMMILPLTLLKVYPSDKCNVIMVLFIFLGIFSMLNGCFTYSSLSSLSVISIIVDLFKNIFHVALMIYLIHFLFHVDKNYSSYAKCG